MSDTARAEDYEFLLWETHDDGRIARIVLNRPEARNAQNRALLVELDDAFGRAESDDDIRVVILGGAGPMFSAGHDLSEGYGGSHPTRLIHGGTRQGAEGRMLQEWHYFFENTLRWRNLRKITVAEVHGPVYAAGLMLMWCCDLIVAADDSLFVDVVGTRLGMCGTEYFAHPWELGPRKAKELLLTGDALGVDEAYELGMVSKVFPKEQLQDSTLAFARRIAALPSMTSLLVKEAVNQSVDNMGFYSALQASFTIHQLNHSHWAEVHDDRTPVALEADGIPNWRKAVPVESATKTSLGPEKE